jgi:hypothetical protein
MRTLLALVGALAAAAALDGAPDARATFPGAVGQIAFPGETGHLHVIDPDGSGDTALTAGTGVLQPSYSADGRQIVYTRNPDRDTAREIFVVGSDGSGRTRLTNNTVGESNPSFSPDGQRIVFVSGARSSAVFAMNADGSGAPTRLGDSSFDLDSGGHPSFSPDGQKIVYYAQSAIHVMNADGSGDVELVSQDARSDPSFSPDGQRIVFRGEQGIRSMNVDGTGEVGLTTNPGDSGPVFSPDGQRIAFSRVGQQSAIWTMNADGSGQARLVTGGGDPSWGSFVRIVPPPQAAETANVEPVKGSVLIKQPGAGRFIRLTRADQIPIGSELDTRRGSVSLTTATGNGAALQSGVFRGGLFKLGQKRVNRPVTELRLTGKLRCGKPRRRARGEATAAARRSRRLFGNARGRFRTRGRNSHATIRGTSWLVKDTCTATLTRSLSGTVVVRDLVKRRTKTLRSGQTYIARRG